jgi:hypothetical protein
MVGLYRVLRFEALRQQAQERRARGALEAWIAAEQRQRAAGPVVDEQAAERPREVAVKPSARR